MNKKKLQEKYDSIHASCQETVATLLKWIFLSIIVGVFVGIIAAAFAKLLTYANDFRSANQHIIWGLPIAGLIIVALYKYSGEEKNPGTNMVIQVVRDDKELMPGRVAPLILVSSLITHLFGGSAGREGAALQFGASVGDWMARKIGLNDSDRKIITLAAMSAAFAGLLGTPMAAAIFPMEVISVGVMYYSALVPCVFSAFISEEISVLLQVRTLTSPYPVTDVPRFYSFESFTAVILAACFALAGILFCTALHQTSALYERMIHNRFLRAALGGVLVIALYYIVGTDAYLGLGDQVIRNSLLAPAGFEMFLLKIVFTCLTLGAGFKGGEIVPAFFIGATLGSALSVAAGMPTALCAACGMVGVFCAVTNSPITSFVIAFELFGADGMPFYCIVIAVSYLLSGYRSLYKEQRIVYSKTENKYINRKSVE